MKKAAVGMLIGLLMVALLVVPALTKGGSAKGTFVKFLAENDAPCDTLYESIIYKTRSGIIHIWVSVPFDMHMVLKPKAKFPNEQGIEYGTFTYNESDYCEQGGDEGELSDFLDESETYWIMQVLQD